MQNKKETLDFEEIAIVIITHNNEGTIEDCIYSLLANDFSGIKKRIFIVDNNSTDTTIKLLDQLKQRNISLEITKLPFNDGFAKTVNWAVKYIKESSSPEFFFLLNPDTTLEKTTIKNLLIKAQEKNPSDLISCKIINPQNNKVWFSGGKINFLKFKAVHRKTQQPEYLTGCALLIRKNVFEKIGFFDSNFFLYYEDVDFSLRARKASLKLAVAKDAICYHKESQSSTSDSKDYFLTRNALYLFHKHYPRIALPYFWMIFFLRLVYHRLISKKKNISRALSDFWHS